ncbi:DUF6326 family protein [Hymenobacter sp. H14-R3]|uniref:DUF6326 family protein n=1 Tax=Hymenobacter sp. H14-R3 TaxID=3046308 RepID=UPI0024BA006D|nr:DUF6326 family protein [Hymenobacter sp. H14-R3]MDJ0367702.1 DUF6326 family protein [Hymenobacter sp. H14-R3]
MKSLPKKNDSRPLADVRVPVRFKLSALWASVLFLYLYGDYFELYEPGKLREMLAGRTALGAVSQGALLSMAVLMAVPSLLVGLSLVLPARATRWLNVGFGALYTVVMLLAIQGSWRFYQFLGGLEMALTALICWVAWTWPTAPEAVLTADPS